MWWLLLTIGIAIGIPCLSCGLCQCPKCVMFGNEECEFMPHKVLVDLQGWGDDGGVPNGNYSLAASCFWHDMTDSDNWCTAFNGEYVLECAVDQCCYDLVIFPEDTSLGPDPPYDMYPPFHTGVNTAGASCGGVTFVACVRRRSDPDGPSSDDFIVRWEFALIDAYDTFISGNDGGFGYFSGFKTTTCDSMPTQSLDIPPCIATEIDLLYNHCLGCIDMTQVWRDDDIQGAPCLTDLNCTRPSYITLTPQGSQ